jgi:hypothetical protein
MQKTKYLRSPCKEVIIVLDPDAMHDALWAGLQLVDYKRVKVINMPVDFDVNDLGKKRTLRIIKKFPYQDYSDLYKRYLEYPKSDRMYERA